METHDAPWVLDDDESVRLGISDAVEVVEQLVLGQPWWQFPFALFSDLLWVELSRGIAYGASFGLVEPYANGLVKEACASIQTGLETACGLRVDRLMA